MKKLILFCSLLFSITLLFGQDYSNPQKIDNEDFQGIIVVSENFYISGQPSENSIAWLKENGVKTVVNLRTQHEMENYVTYDEAAKLEEAGIKYIHIPQSGNSEETPYNPEALEKFAKAVKKADGKVLLHCTVAWRASHMWAAYLIRYKKYSVDEAIDIAKKINFGTLPIEGFLDTKMSLKNID